ncbi:chitin synthase [Chytriomyces cf. hyalinus JEL632]|nr:chitin synthase [Chytriomyces cf. hyalinus JEL632]
MQHIHTTSHDAPLPPPRSKTRRMHKSSRPRPPTATTQTNNAAPTLTTTLPSLSRRSSLYGIPTLDRLGAVDSGTLRTTLNRGDRNPSANTLRRTKPMMRSSSAEPPSARLGATSNRVSASLPRPPAIGRHEQRKKNCLDCGGDPWIHFSKLVTCCFFPGLLKLLGKSNPVAQQAWREKIGLCVVIVALCAAVGFLTFGLQVTLCPPQSYESYSYFNKSSSKFALSNTLADKVIIRGQAYNFHDVRTLLLQRNLMDINGTNFVGQDLTLLFTPPQFCQPFQQQTWTCASISSAIVSAAGIEASPKATSCPSLSWLENLPRHKLTLSWNDITQYSATTHHKLIVFNNMVLNASSTATIPPFTDPLINAYASTDATRIIHSSRDLLAATLCLQERAIIGYIDSIPLGCLASSAILTLSTIVILTLVFTKFFMALFFHWFMAERLVKPHNVTASHIVHVEPEFDPTPHTVMLVTCYSEGEGSVKATLDSLVKTDYPDGKKLLFVVADGLVVGAGETRSTPDIVLGLVELDYSLPYPVPSSYLAIADGSRQHNMGYVYSGHYNCDGHRVATIVVVKCGTLEENDAAKPGNRGKRDSQMILMNFLSRCLFKDRMTRLDCDMQLRIRHLLRIHPSQLEYVLMVDADTDVHSAALKHMINAMLNDRNIMGLCGETRIRNKSESWVTAIQVFEYYASHHLGKAFESIFGGVTCLPGCFSMYRIKISKGSGRFVPLLVNPDIVEEYSENVVLTLHQKNLLLLGEDRFLSTLMLRNFPKRKMMFVPQAVCHTVVPNEFKILLSQRRRWINSTVHNLMELLLVRELCGIFCFSMQFVVLLELIGTVVLPAAISFTIFLLVQTAVTGQVQLIPMLLLLFILGLPGILIVLTSRKMAYIVWMAVYMLSLPIWNFVLPVYAFWHFDDFSWGQTRRVDGETRGGGEKDGGHGNDGHSREQSFDPSRVELKTWEEWVHFDDAVPRKGFQAGIETVANTEHVARIR